MKANSVMPGRVFVCWVNRQAKTLLCLPLAGSPYLLWALYGNEGRGYIAGKRNVG